MIVQRVDHGHDSPACGHARARAGTVESRVPLAKRTEHRFGKAELRAQSADPAVIRVVNGFLRPVLKNLNQTSFFYEKFGGSSI
jgi:hypothetical protein